MGKQLKVVFDRDGVLNELNQKVAETVGVLYDLFKTYNITENTHFSEDVRTAIYRCYKDPQIFADVPPAKGVEEIARLKNDKRVYLVVHSLSYSDVIANVKKEWDKKHGIDFFDEYMDCCGEQKEMKDAFILVEDCIDNILRSPAKYKILINQPYNQGAIPDNTFRVDGIPEAIKIIEELIKKVPES